MNPVSLLAYIDPMSGSLLLQAIIAGVITCAAYFRHWIGKCLGLLARPFKRSAGTHKQPGPDAGKADATSTASKPTFRKAG